MQMNTKPSNDLLVGDMSSLRQPGSLVPERTWLSVVRVADGQLGGRQWLSLTAQEDRQTLRSRTSQARRQLGGLWRQRGSRGSCCRMQKGEAVEGERRLWPGRKGHGRAGELMALARRGQSQQCGQLIRREAGGRILGEESLITSFLLPLSLLCPHHLTTRIHHHIHTFCCRRFAFCHSSGV